MGDILIRGGTVINADDRKQADVLIHEGKIAQVGLRDQADRIDPVLCSEIIDAAGLLVLPGAIDAHTHLEMKMGRTFSADGYESGTAAAACGGVTTVFDYTLQENGRGMIEEIEARNRLAEGKTYVDYAFHGGISEVNERTLDEVSHMAEQGFGSIKAYMTYDFGLDDRSLYRLLKAASAAKVLITVHAESDAMVSVNREELIRAGRVDNVWYHYLSRPEIAEEEADIRAILLARAAGAPIYIVHVASAEGINFIRQYRENYDPPYPIFAETCPHYLEFSNEVYKRPDGLKFICSPPIKGEASRKALWEGLSDGNINVIATDHCPAQSFEKEWGRDDFTKAPNGCMGIENMYPYILDAAGKGRISYERAVELCSSNPARIFGCDTKGFVEPGKDADIVLYDPEKHFTITAEKMHSKIDYTIYEGKELKGYPVMTMSRGRVVYRDGELVGSRGYGRLVRRGISAAYGKIQPLADHCALDMRL